jgi:hypothetical protein
VRRYEILHLLARRLGLKVGRAQAILSKLQEAGVIGSPGDCRRHPDDMAEPEIVTLLIALFGESGIVSAASAARTFSALLAEDGGRLDSFLSEVLFGPPISLRHVVVRQSPPGVSVIANGQHVLFGAPSSTSTASPARIVPGEALVAIAAELRGATPPQADAEAALGQLARALQ